MLDLQALAENVKEHFADVITSSDPAVSDSQGQAWRNSHALLIAAIQAAYPDVPANHVYKFWTEVPGAAIAHCATYVAAHPDEF